MLCPIRYYYVKSRKTIIVQIRNEEKVFCVSHNLTKGLVNIVAFMHHTGRSEMNEASTEKSDFDIFDFVSVFIMAHIIFRITAIYKNLA